MRADWVRAQDRRRQLVAGASTLGLYAVAILAFWLVNLFVPFDLHSMPETIVVDLGASAGPSGSMPLGLPQAPDRPQGAPPAPPAPPGKAAPPPSPAVKATPSPAPAPKAAPAQPTPAPKAAPSRPGPAPQPTPGPAAKNAIPIPAEKPQPAAPAAPAAASPAAPNAAAASAAAPGATPAPAPGAAAPTPGAAASAPAAAVPAAPEPPPEPTPYTSRTFSSSGTSPSGSAAGGTGSGPGIAGGTGSVTFRGVEMGNALDTTFGAASGKIGRQMYVPIYLSMPLPATVDGATYDRIPNQETYTAEARKEAFRQYYQRSGDGWRLKGNVPLAQRSPLWDMLQDAGFDPAKADYKTAHNLAPVVLEFVVSPASGRSRPDLVDIRVVASSGEKDIDAAVVFGFKQSVFYNGSGNAVSGRFVYRFTEGRSQ